MSTPAQLHVVELPVGKLHAADWNANRVTPATLAKIRNSIRRFGVVENSVVRPCRCDRVRGRHYEVLSGNHRLEIYTGDRVLEGKGPKGGRGSGGDHYMRSADHKTTSISGDTRVDWSEAFELVPSLNVAYVWHAGQYAAPVQAGLERIGFVIAQQIVWDKEAFALSRAHYHWQHEAAFYAARVGAEVPWYGPQHTTAWYARKKGRHLPFLGDRNQSTVWRVPSPKMAAGGSDEAEYDHPTQKPVELYTRPILNHLEPGGSFYDCFAGSGSGLIAAELTGRVGYLMELDPLFVDVIRQRYADYVSDPSLAP